MGSLAIRFVKKGVDLYFKCRGDKGFKYTKIDRHYLEKGEGITIHKAIEISRAAGAIKNAGGDFLEYIKKATGKKAEDLKQDDIVNKQTGGSATFYQLLTDYLELHLKGRRGYKSTKNSLKNHVFEVKRFQFMLDLPANEIQPASYCRYYFQAYS